MFKTDKSHTHNKKNVGISVKTKTKIDELYRSVITRPKIILRNLSDSGFKEPKYTLLGNYLNSLRSRIHGNNKTQSLSTLDGITKTWHATFS